MLLSITQPIRSIFQSSLKVNCFSGCFLRETVQTANKKTLWYWWQYFSVIIIINILFLLFFRKKLCKICQSCLKKKRLRYSIKINYTNFSHKLLDIKRAIVLGSELFKCNVFFVVVCLFIKRGVLTGLIFII